MRNIRLLVTVALTITVFASHAAAQSTVVEIDKYVASVKKLTNSTRTRIIVADNGLGISVANRPRVFQPFFTTARNEGGTGLGLAIVRAIAAGAGGSAELLDSAQGAAFRIELPRGRAPGQ